MLELVHALSGVGEPDCSYDVVVHWVADFVAKPAVELRRILLELENAPAC
jgi:hypothetical protein